MVGYLVDGRLERGRNVFRLQETVGRLDARNDISALKTGSMTRPPRLFYRFREVVSYHRSGCRDTNASRLLLLLPSDTIYRLRMCAAWILLSNTTSKTPEHPWLCLISALKRNGSGRGGRRTPQARIPKNQGRGTKPEQCKIAEGKIQCTNSDLCCMHHMNPNICLYWKLSMLLLRRLNS